MRKLLILCGALLVVFIAACDSNKPTTKKDADLPADDSDLIIGDEDQLFDDVDEVSESAPDTEGVKPEGDVKPESDIQSDDDGVEPSDDGIDIGDDGMVEPDDDLEPVEGADVPEGGDVTDTTETPVVDDNGIVPDQDLPVDDYVGPDTDSPVGCDDQVMCTEDVLSGGQCDHLPRHDRCPDGQLCNGTDGCVDPGDWVCRSCQNGQSDCKYATDVCTPLLGEKFCMMPCKTSAECPATFACNDLYDTEGTFLGTGCTPGNFVCCLNLDGDVAGVGAKCTLKDCDESSASIYPGATEVCNGKDDDCDDQIDDQLGVAPLCGKQDGICQGSQKVCGETAGWLDCDTALYAAWNSNYQATETECDGLDNDCNGQVDEPFASELQQVCMVGIGECRRVGFTVCNTAGDGVECNATAGTPALDELCNDKDDNCNGTTDEGFDGKNTPCFAGQGACLRAGVYACSTDGYELVCDAVPGTGTTESCNGIDDDCNGTVDNGVTASAPTCTNTAGVCAGTVKKCAGSQGWLDCGQTDYIVASGGLYQEGTETLCDGADNDCDGSTDEALTNYAPACDNPVGAASPLIGVCIGARKSCGGGSGWQTCGAAQFGANYQTTEALCDYLDNDCDGTIDEGFLNGGTGKYDQNTACGNCATNCTVIYNKANSYGTCNAAGDPICVLNCNTDTFNLNAIPDDGCEFVLDTTAIYVSASDETAFDTAGCGFGPSTTGGGRYPCKSISYALQRAVATGRANVLVADGTYEETVTLVNGKNLLGGYRPDNWGRHVSTTMTIVRGDDTAHEPHKITFYANGITAATVLEGFVIYGQGATGTAGNSYAIYVTGSNNQFAIRNNVIYGAAGGPGTSAGQAAAGAAGGNGGTRSDNPSAYDAIQTNHVSGNSECNNSRSNANGAYQNGGASSCGVAGGHGGGNVCSPSYNTQNSGQPGNNGSGSAPGSGGAEGFDGSIGSVSYGVGYDCTVPDNHMDGYNGTSGGNGGNGGGGSGCSGANGTVSGGHWLGATGGVGAAGTAGSGGGGGGAGGGGNIGSGSYDDVLGGRGGGGGAGGCGGTAGSGGGGGGGSFVIFLTASGSAVVIQNNVITLGNGGRGGNGGGGGSGGQGGVGGTGGYAGIPVPLNCGNAGGTGGNGGNGGNGGGGGGGCGGTAIGIGYSGTAPSISGSTYSGGAGGAGGAGGSSMGTAGTAGTTGSVANTRAF